MRIAFRTAASRACPTDMSHRPLSTTYVVAIDVADLPVDERRSQIQRLFESPLGPFISEATLARHNVHLVLHVPFAKMKRVQLHLRELFPAAVIQDIHPREFDHRRDAEAS